MFELADANLRPPQIGHDADGAAGIPSDRTRSPMTRARWSSAVPWEKLRRTIEFDARHHHAQARARPHHWTRGPRVATIFRTALHAHPGQPLARCSRISTAPTGSFLPSRVNSGKGAPPAVEMYPTLSSILKTLMAETVSPPPARKGPWSPTRDGVMAESARQHRCRDLGEGFHLEDADRAVPDHGAGGGDDGSQGLGGIRADVEDQVVVGDPSMDLTVAAAWPKLGGHDHVGGERHLDLARMALA